MIIYKTALTTWPLSQSLDMEAYNFLNYFFEEEKKNLLLDEMFALQNVAKSILAKKLWTPILGKPLTAINFQFFHHPTR